MPAQEVVALAGALPGCRVERCAVDPFGRFDPVAQQLAGHILAGARPPLPPPPHGLRLKELPPCAPSLRLPALSTAFQFSPNPKKTNAPFCWHSFRCLRQVSHHIFLSVPAHFPHDI